MILNQLLLIPLLGAILIAMSPVKEISEQEAYAKLEAELGSANNNKEENEKKIEVIINNLELEYMANM